MSLGSFPAVATGKNRMAKMEKNKLGCSKALVIGGREVQSYDMTNVAQMARMADVLKTHIVRQKLFTNISGKNYAHVEGWQFGGGLLGLMPRIVKVENMSSDKEARWMTEVEIVNMKTGTVVSRGFALCSDKEAKRRTSDEYVILSMSQTRAIGKAYRNVLGWVMKLAGYESTPAEEMPKAADHKLADVKKETIAETMRCKACEDEGADSAISKQVADYSLKVYGKSLCQGHQRTEKKVAQHG